MFFSSIRDINTESTEEVFNCGFVKVDDALKSMAFILFLNGN